MENASKREETQQGYQCRINVLSFHGACEVG
jgi:hypothetical protein